MSKNTSNKCQDCWLIRESLNMDTITTTVPPSITILCVPKHMLKENRYRIHNSPTGGHLGMTRAIAEIRRRFYCPNYIEKIAAYIRNRSSCLQVKQVQPSRLKPPLQEITKTTSFPGDILQMDIMGAYPTTPYKYILTAIDVFSIYLFAVPLMTVSASTVASALVSMLFNHSYIPKEKK